MLITSDVLLGGWAGNVYLFAQPRGSHPLVLPPERRSLLKTTDLATAGCGRGLSPLGQRLENNNDFKRYFGKDDAPVLVWQAATRVMNPTVPQEFIDAQFDRDPASASSEYDAKFRTDIESLVTREIVDAVTVSGRHELPFLMSTVSYFCFVDPSGGSVDAMTMAIAHREGKIPVLDMVREVKAPFSPDAVCRTFAAEMKRYGLTSCVGDRYGGEWPAERFGAHGIEYITSERSRSEIYLELLPILNGHRCELLDNPRLTAQLMGLERRTARGGRDSIDHAPNAHDDVINSAAGAIVLAIGEDDDPGYWKALSRKSAAEEAAARNSAAGLASPVDAGADMLARHFAQLQLGPTPSAPPTSKPISGAEFLNRMRRG
jgi:hypothetical protein